MLSVVGDQIGKRVRQGCILSPCLFNLYAEDIMRNTGLEEAQAGIKIAGRNINNLITSWQIDQETVETVTDFILEAPTSLQMLTAAMK